MSSTALWNFRTQREAFERAREIAINNGQEVAIHGVNGRIRAKHSYGNDPCPQKGKLVLGCALKEL